MWELINRTPFAAERSFVRDRDGAEVYLLVVRGTFLIEPDGTTRAAEQQVPVCDSPRYHGRPGASSLAQDGDLEPGGLATDVLLDGHAYAPGGRPAIAVEATMRVGPVTKTVLAIGDRSWKRDGASLTDPVPFVTMPLRYERAYGGRDGAEQDPRNPVGLGFALSASTAAGTRAPNLEEPGALITSWKQRPRPAGFGPIAREWSPRRELAGTFDERWARERMPLVPTDFDVRCHQTAPVDQQVPGYLQGGEPVELKNLTPAGSLRFDLPAVTPAAKSRIGDELVPHALSLHTVLLEPDAPRVTLVWRARVPCQRTVHVLHKTKVYLPPAELDELETVRWDRRRHG